MAIDEQNTRLPWDMGGGYAPSLFFFCFESLHWFVRCMIYMSWVPCVSCIEDIVAKLWHCHSAEVLANGYIKVSRSETDEVCRAVLTVLRCKTFYRRTLTFFPSFPLAGSLPSPHFNSHSIFTRSDNTLSHAVKSRKSISLSRPVKANSFKNHLERPDMK